MKDGNKIPKTIRDALEAYSYYEWQKDQGFDKIEIESAENNWDEKRNKLIKWCQNIKNRK